MRICLYTSTALPTVGGQELVVDALARQFTSLGHEVVVLAPRPGRPWRLGDGRLPYPVVRHPRFISMRRMVEWYGWWLVRLCRRHPFDVLHCHGLYPTGYLAARCRGRLGIPLALTSHGEDVYDGYPRLAEPRLYQRHVEALAGADVLVAISRFTREGYLRLCPHARRIVDIPNGVAPEPFATRAARPAGLDPAIRQGRYVLFLGRLDHRKGVDLVLHALATLPPGGQVQLVIAGDGGQRPALESLTKTLRLDDRVRFVGWARGVTKAYLLQNARCLVVPSRQWEAFGLVVLESYAAGCPVIAARLPGLCDLVHPGRTGWLVPPESPPDLARALEKVFDDRLASERLRQQTVELARQYAWDVIARRHLDLYGELIGSRRPPE